MNVALAVKVTNVTKGAETLILLDFVGFCQQPSRSSAPGDSHLALLLIFSQREYLKSRIQENVTRTINCF